MGKPLFDYSHLTPDDRVRIADELWESLADQPEILPLTAAQAEELDRRFVAYRKDPSGAIPWQEALEEIENSGA